MVVSAKPAVEGDRASETIGAACVEVEVEFPHPDRNEHGNRTEDTRKTPLSQLIVHRCLRAEEYLDS